MTGVLRLWHQIRLVVGCLLLVYGLWLIGPVMLPGLLQQTAPGQVVEIYADDEGGSKRMHVLFEYRLETDDAITINLGHDLAGATGEPIEAPLMDADAAALLLQAVKDADGADQLPCRVFYGGGEPRVYCPMLVGDRRRWQRGVVSLSIPVILLLSTMLHQMLSVRQRHEPLAVTSVDDAGGVA